MCIASKIRVMDLLRCIETSHEIDFFFISALTNVFFEFVYYLIGYYNIYR